MRHSSIGMSENNKFAYPFLIVAGTLGCLIALSCVQNSFSLKDFTSRQVDLLAELRTKANPGDPGSGDSTSLAGPDGTSSTPGVPTDSTSTSPADSLAVPHSTQDFETYTGILDDWKTIAAPSNTGAGISHFMDALRDLKAGKRKKVRIAYFGDSMIEGDLITEDLRDSLQVFFGGEGVGFVPVTSIVASFRTTINHTFSKDWTDYHYKNLPSGNLALGISGHTFLPSSGSWVKYSPVKKPRLDRFEEVNLFFGPGNGAVTANDHAYTLAGGQAVNSLALPADSSNGLMLKFSGANPPLYGVSFESPEGVFVDNFSFRGISGIELGRLTRDMLSHLQQEHPYDLIILQYGANILWKPELTDYSWYERPMTKVLDSLRSDFAQTSFLMISTADKSYRHEDKYVTAPGVPALLKVQHEMAEAHQAAFWNLYRSMGGSGSMTQWVEAEHPLANKDYTHFNRQGAAKVGALLYKALLNEYHEDEKQ